MIPSRFFCPITNNFPPEDSGPLIITLELIQPVEVALLQIIHNFKFNHKLYYLIPSSTLGFSATPEEVAKIRALDLFWLLLQTKVVIRMLAKFLKHSITKKTSFPNELFPELDSR